MYSEIAGIVAIVGRFFFFYRYKQNEIIRYFSSDIEIGMEIRNRGAFSFFPNNVEIFFKLVNYFL